MAERSAQQLMRDRITRSTAQSVRATVDGQQYLSFCSNDYLGLANHPEVVAAAVRALESDGVGSGASHLVNGHHQEHELLEQELAEFTGRQAALLFGSGYMANVGVISALLSRRDSAIQDKLNHASLLDGALMSQAKLQRYAHLDVEQLDQQLGQATGKKLVITDGVFSMDGDVAPLVEISEVAKRHQAWLMVDDAHGFGVLGEQGEGLVGKLGLGADQVPLLVGTFGKAFGTSGAFVAGDQTTIDFLQQFARPAIYTTATPVAIATATRVALKLVRSAQQARTHLTGLIAQFRSGAQMLGFDLPTSMTPIQPILVGSNERALNLSERLKAQNILVTAIRPPTVPQGTARLRVTFSAEHSSSDVEQLLEALKGLR